MGRSRRWCSWNVRGLGNAEKRREVKEVLKKVKLELILLQETKLGENKDRVGELFAKSINLNFAEVHASGSAGGLISCWDSGIISVDDVIKDQSFILLVAKVPFLSAPVLIGNVYSPNVENQRIATYPKLAAAVSNLGLGCFLGGDFNGTLNPGERKGGIDVIDPGLSDLVSGLNLIDLPLANAEFTWFSTRHGGLWSRLDRWLISEEILREIDGVHQSVEEWGLSDHRAISLSMGAVDFGPKPFRFYNNWMLEEDFKYLVNAWWNSPLVAGWSGASLLDKLKELKKEIKRWKGSRPNAMSDRISSLETDLQSVMDQILRDGASNALRAKRL
ncbi:uncharacterized protein LOC130736174 [Lotus japonicus]|uniref:uncharacterized protein LOC130736174 n=1 Tax=Lotus japonicus TaxID=34305 RepID=UPI0025867519|nr:uncharacterized protein LOC130736174 [Lotus japonicus]